MSVKNEIPFLLLYLPLTIKAKSCFLCLIFSIINLLFNFLMLGAGYIGELGKLTKTSANMLGFVFFTLMYGTIWSVYMRNKKTINSQVIFWLFVILTLESWSKI